LLLVELLAREEAGDNPVIDEYHLRFPSHGQRLEQEISRRRALRQQEAARPSKLLAEVTPLPATEADAEPPAEAADGLPDLVAGYEVLEELGRGGMGVVYKARHCTLGRTVALKMILGARFASSDELVRFRLEGETAARVQHPNIVQVYEVGTHNGQPFMVLEYVEGGSLSQRLKESRLSVEQSAKLIAVLPRAPHLPH